MNCPACGQPSEARWAQDCPLCGFPVGELNRRIFPIYLVTTAVFLSTVIYAVVVYVLSTSGTIQANPSGEMVFYILLVMVIPVAIAIPIVKNVMVKATLAEAPAVYGLVAYFLTADIAKFAIFLGISWVLFIWLSTQIIGYVTHIQREAVEKWQRESRRCE